MALFLILLCVSIGFTNALATYTVVLNNTNKGIVGDAYVTETSPNANFGSSTLLGAGFDIDARRAYYMFNLSAIPQGATILNANFSDYASSTYGYSGTFELYNTSLLNSSGAVWDENTLTWNNQPEIRTLQDTQNYGTATSQNASWNITNAVQTAVRQSNNKVSIEIQHIITSVVIELGSKEKTPANMTPQLTVTYTWNLNLTAWDETNPPSQLSPINATLLNFSYSYSYSSVDSILSGAPDVPLNSVTASISRGDYYPRTYYLTISPNTQQNVSVYLIPYSDVFHMTQTFYANTYSSQPVSEVVLTVSKVIDGVQTTVMQGTTGSNGGVTFDMDYQTVYRIIADSPTCVGMLSAFQPNPTQPTATIYCGINSTLGFQGVYNDVSYNLTHGQTIISGNFSGGYNATNPFQITFNIYSKNSTLNLWGLNLTYSDGTLLYSYMNSTSASGGNATVNIDPTNKGGKVIIAYAFFKDLQYSNSSTYIYNITNLFPIRTGVVTNGTSLTDILEGNGVIGSITTQGLSTTAEGFIAVIIALLVTGAWAKTGINIGGSGLIFILVFSLVGIGLFQNGSIMILCVLLWISFAILKWFG